MSKKLDQSKLSGPHFQLARMAGKWRGTARTWFTPPKVEDESSISGSMRLILDGMFILHEYTSSFGGRPITGMAIYGFNLVTEKYQCAWIDSFHNGSAIMFSQGEKGTTDMRVLGGYSFNTPEAEQHWGWRTEIDFRSDEELVITAYNISPEGNESLATETVYFKIVE